ncbi:class I SAM-dependent methyltransferase [Rhizobium azibense]|uniref:Methyltransferase family protein n=1 Tax=Rhizobium azibense TaxID=1136135 RepID=A0A4R3RBM8_9HYPH|nr:class I SAM-dependent methyltransferase [Rhizobium azibense]TCU32830.1 methyltransferase family protein [Rhizobium azibense]
MGFLALEAKMNTAFKRSDNWGVFNERVATDFQIRPGYAREALSVLDAELYQTGGSARVADIGAGTGIFTRQIAELVTNAKCVVGIEPSDEMRRVAAKQPCARPVEYIPGSAEDLPYPALPYDLVTAAMAAHRFNRPLFFDAIPKILRVGGVVAFVDNLPRQNASRLHDAYLTLQETYVPDFRRGMNTNGETGGYFFLDLAGEMERHGAFKDVRQFQWDNDYYLDEETFRTFANSSTISLRIIEKIGKSEFSQRIKNIFLEANKNDSNMKLTYATKLVIGRLR